MRHKKTPPKKGVHPTIISELCPNCNAPLRVNTDPEKERVTKYCISCKWVHQNDAAFSKDDFITYS